jgi:hypothetical protein
MSFANDFINHGLARRTQPRTIVLDQGYAEILSLSREVERLQIKLYIMHGPAQPCHALAECAFLCNHYDVNSIGMVQHNVHCKLQKPNCFRICLYLSYNGDCTPCAVSIIAYMCCL